MNNTKEVNVGGLLFITPKEGLTEREQLKVLCQILNQLED